MSEEVLKINLSASDLEANSLPPILSTPVVANAKLNSVVIDKIKGDYDIIDMNFTILDGESKGKEFRHRIFGYKPYPDSTEPEKDLLKWSKHIGYILKYFITEKNALAIMQAQDNTWNKIRGNVQRAFETDALAVIWKEKIVKIKVIGYITQQGHGKAVLGFPRYLGFISDAESDHQVVFSKRELQQNAQYLEKYQKEITATGSAALNSTEAGADTSPEGGIDF